LNVSYSSVQIWSSSHGEKPDAIYYILYVVLQKVDGPPVRYRNKHLVNDAEICLQMLMISFPVLPMQY